MSRRDSRNSLGARQSNALEEFENFKKKYLLVNKHIAKLNSSLNVRIEELLSKIAELNIDNLRLRASELSLSRKLESEQEKSRRLYMEAEAATQLLYSQITSLSDTFGIGKPAGTNPLREQAAAARNRPPKIPAPPIARLARPPDFETLVEAAEESTPPRSSRRTAYSPPPDPVTPVSRHRSTGSTPTSGTAAETTKTPPPGQEDNRRSSVPLSMEITNGSSPLTACISSVENLALSPSPTQSPKEDKASSSVILAGEKLPDSKDEIPHMTFKLNGLRRISRRPSGLLMTEQDKFGVPPAKTTATPVSVEIPSSESKAGQGSYPTPLSAKDVPSTPPRSRSMLAPPGVSPAASTKSIPMSPVLTANPALSPPPTKKISLTRRQLDFGIVDPEDQSDDEDAESGEKMPVAEGLLGVESDSVVGKRAMKRKEPEDGEDLFSAPPKPTTSRKRQERRRDTGPVHTGMVLEEKSNIDTILKDRESKDSLRDVTNERSTPPLVIRPPDEKPKISFGFGIGKPAPSVKTVENGAPPLSVAGLAAKLERLSTRPKPPAPPAPLPLPSSDKDIKIPLAEEEAPVDSKPESVGAELGRRESGRQRKSVNYKEPSLLSKMRKPDPSGAPSSSSAPSSSASFTTTSLQAAQKPPRRKKGSISLIGDVVNGSTASLVSNEGENHIASATTPSEMALPIDIERKRRRATALRRFGDLTDDDIDDSDEEDQPENAKQSTPAPNQSRYTFSGLQGLRGPSILSRGANPLVGSAPPSSSASETISVAVARTTAALRMAPGSARERLREEITSGITSGARREREKERLREEERERERERARETPNDLAV